VPRLRDHLGCPTLAASLFLRLGWDATQSPLFQPPCPVFATSFRREGGKPQMPPHRLGCPMGCPTLAASLFLRLGWDAMQHPVPTSVPRLRDFFPSRRRETTNAHSPSGVPHPRRVFVLAARVGCDAAPFVPISVPRLRDFFPSRRRETTNSPLPSRVPHPRRVFVLAARVGCDAAPLVPTSVPRLRDFFPSRRRETTTLIN
jgi:hypothetical protein